MQCVLCDCPEPVTFASTRWSDAGLCEGLEVLAQVGVCTGCFEEYFSILGLPQVFTEAIRLLRERSLSAEQQSMLSQLEGAGLENKSLPSLGVVRWAPTCERTQ